MGRFTRRRWREFARPDLALSRADGVEAVMRLLEVSGEPRPHARARDILPAEGIARFALQSTDLADTARPSESAAIPQRGASGRRSARHPAARRNARLRHRPRLRPCRRGVAANDLADAAEAAGANGIRAAPGRALIAIGLTARQRPDFAAAANAWLYRARRRSAPPRRRLCRCADLRIRAYRGARDGAAHRRTAAPD